MLPANYLLRAEDLDGDKLEDFVGRYTKKWLAAGTALNAATLAPAPVLPSEEGAFVGAAARPDQVQGGRVNAELPVWVCRAEERLLQSARVEAVICKDGGAPCTAFLRVAALGAITDFAKLRVDAESCAVPPPAAPAAASDAQE
jgi:hypothetical protein